MIILTFHKTYFPILHSVVTLKRCLKSSKLEEVQGKILCFYYIMIW